MDLSNLFSHLISVSSSLHTHWNFYSAVALGIVAALALNPGTLEPFFAFLLVVGLFVFLVSNFTRIDKTVKELKIVENEIKYRVVSNVDDANLSDDFKAYYLQEASRAFKLWYVFHVIIDVFLILLILLRIKWT